MKPEELCSRWTPEISDLGLRSLQGSGDDPYPQLADGRHDLRGLTISQFVKNVKVSDADLSYCSTDGFGQFGMCHVLRCSFYEAKLTTNIGSDFQMCDFSVAHLRGVVLRGKFVECDFSSADLSSAMGNQVTFVGCTFIKTNFRKATLAHCLFDDCTFAACKFGSGSLASSRFVRSPMASIELGNTLMEKVIFSE